MLHDAALNHGQRFVEKTTEATVSYAHAGCFASLIAATTLIEAWTDVWADAVDAPRSNTKSWFREPEKIEVFAPWAFWPAPAASNAWTEHGAPAQPWFTNWWASGQLQLPNPWLGLLPAPPFDNTDFSFTRSPFWNTQAAALPMIWSLMSVGVPHNVAKPTAEANAAALEAMDAARQMANENAAVYTKTLKSASRQTSVKPTVPNPADLFTLFWPWLDLPRSGNTTAAA